MSSRRSLGLPIILAICMIVLLVALAVGWILMAGSGSNWSLLAVGTTLFVLVLVGTVLYLLLTIKAINLNQRQSNFIDSVSHELKSPIASLKLYLQTLSQRHVDQQQQEGFYRYMLEDVERLDHLINHLLDAAHLDRQNVNEDQETVDLASLLTGCAYAVCVRHRVTTETVQLDLEPCLARAPRVDLDMIFRNLIDNAVKYAGEVPKVVVRLVQDRDGSVVVRISDNGAGIPTHLRRKIFGRFVRLGHELVRKQPGTGLGLYIVRTLVKRLRGRIRVRDAEDGTGTVFEVRLPQFQTHDAKRSDKEVKPSPATPQVAVWPSQNL